MEICEGTHAERVRKKIVREEDPIKAVKIALNFFAKTATYTRGGIGWGEDYADSDDGALIAKAARKRLRELI